MKNKKSRALARILIGMTLAASPFILALILGLHNVKKTITAQDALYIEKILDETDFAGKIAASQTVKNSSIQLAVPLSEFMQEIAIIRAAQDSMFMIAPETRLIPRKTPREPKNLYEARAGYCGDRSRTLDKALRHLGFETRYATILQRNTQDTQNPHNKTGSNILSALLSRGGGDTRSHALIEVRTSKGWMAVDSRRHWIALRADGTPHSLADLRKNGTQSIAWHETSPEAPWPLLQNRFHVIYGLYSRHGQFYPPYTPYIPDINWREFTHNLAP